MASFRPFNAKSKCPKCGYDDVSTQYIERGNLPGMPCWNSPLTVSNNEHLHRYCRRCAFVWCEACIDLEQETLQLAADISFANYVEEKISGGLDGIDENVPKAEQYRPGLEDGFEYEDQISGITITSGMFAVSRLDGVRTYPYITTIDGRCYISDGDLIVTDVNGERYLCRPKGILKTIHGQHESCDHEIVFDTSGIRCVICGKVFSQQSIIVTGVT